MGEARTENGVSRSPHHRIGRRLQAARLEAGRVPREVAAHPGASRTPVSHLERGAQRANLDQLDAGADLHGVAPRRLLLPALPYDGS